MTVVLVLLAVWFAVAVVLLCVVAALFTNGDTEGYRPITLFAIAIFWPVPAVAAVFRHLPALAKWLVTKK